MLIILKTAFIHDARSTGDWLYNNSLLFIAIFDTIKRKLAIRSEFRPLKTPSSFWILRVKTLFKKNKVSDGKNCRNTKHFFEKDAEVRFCLN
jgi:hypothetical protein